MYVAILLITVDAQLLRHFMALPFLFLSKNNCLIENHVYYVHSPFYVLPLRESWYAMNPFRDHNELFAKGTISKSQDEYVTVDDRWLKFGDMNLRRRSTFDHQALLAPVEEDDRWTREFSFSNFCSLF